MTHKGQWWPERKSGLRPGLEEAGGRTTLHGPGSPQSWAQGPQAVTPEVPGPGPPRGGGFLRWLLARRMPQPPQARPSCSPSDRGWPRRGTSQLPAGTEPGKPRGRRVQLAVYGKWRPGQQPPTALGPRAAADLTWARQDGPHGADLRVPAPAAPRRHASPGFRRAALFCTEELGVRSPATPSRPARRGEAGSRARRRWSPRPRRRPGHPRCGAHPRPRPRGCSRCRSRRRRVRPSRAR